MPSSCAVTTCPGDVDEDLDGGEAVHSKLLVYKARRHYVWQEKRLSIYWVAAVRHWSLPMSPDYYALYLLLAIGTVLTPGPAVIYTIGNTLTRGSRHAIAGFCGVATGILLVAAMALATRFEESRQVRVVTREVPRYVTLPLPAPAARMATASPAATVPAADPVVSRPPVVARPEPVAPPLPEPAPIATPQIADPQTERLVKEARQARVAAPIQRSLRVLVR